jgi:peptide/nickel transport system permease protein
MSAAAPTATPARVSTWTRARGNVAIITGLAICLTLVAMAILAPWVAPFDPNKQMLGPQLADPSATHWFGLDSFGRDVFSRIVHGARISLWVGVVATLAAMLIGTVIGIVAGYFGGTIDRVITMVTDVLLSFPQLVMGLLLVAVLGANLTNIIIAIAVTAIPAFIRLARGSTLAMRERDFIDAGRALGFSDARIMFLHVLPNIMDEIIVMGSLWLATAIRTESTLAFIGLGVPPPTATWGGIIREGFEYLNDNYLLAVFPSLAILVTMIGLNLIGDGLRDATDPRAPQ